MFRDHVSGVMFLIVVDAEPFKAADPIAALEDHTRSHRGLRVRIDLRAVGAGAFAV